MRWKTCVCCYTFHESTRNLHKHTPFVTSIATYRRLSCHVITNRSYASDKNCPEPRTTRIPCEQVINHRRYITTSLHRHFVNTPPLGPLTVQHGKREEAALDRSALGGSWCLNGVHGVDHKDGTTRWCTRLGEFARDVTILSMFPPDSLPLKVDNGCLWWCFYLCIFGFTDLSRLRPRSKLLQGRCG